MVLVDDLQRIETTLMSEGRKRKMEEEGQAEPEPRQGGRCHRPFFLSNSSAKSNSSQTSNSWGNLSRGGSLGGARGGGPQGTTN